MNVFLKIYYKFGLDVMWNTFMSGVVRKNWKPYMIMNARDTVNYIIEKQCSVARFGDGELHVAAYGCGLRFQRADKNLQNKLNEVIQKDNERLLLCLPNRINMVTDEERVKLVPFWQNALKVHLYPWTKRFSKKKLYGDTNFTRLTDCQDKAEQIKQVQHIREIWFDRNIVIIEGEKTRFGVGNDLLENAKSVKRILGPAESAFDRYEELLRACNRLAKEVENPLVLLALGPTATVLAADLTDLEIQAIDLGHLDIAYERILRNCDGKIPGKYTNESEGGNIVDDCVDVEYISQIAERIYA